MGDTTSKVPQDYEAVTIDNTVGGVGLTAGKAIVAGSALVTLETAQIRFTLDGTAPTTSVGHLMEVGDILNLDKNAQLQGFMGIRTGGTSGAIKVTYFV